MRRRAWLVAALAGAVLVLTGATPAATPAGTLAVRRASAADPCVGRYPDGTSSTNKRTVGSQTSYSRSASLYQVCEGWGAPDSGGFTLTPSMKCAIIAAAAVYGGPAVSLPTSRPCQATDILRDLNSGRWAGAAKDVGCGFFSDIFATAGGIFVAGATAEAGPGSVAIGVAAYKALLAGMHLACGGVLTLSSATKLGISLESKHETAVALDITRRGKCLHLTNRPVLGLQWSAATCTLTDSTGGGGSQPQRVYFVLNGMIMSEPAGGGRARKVTTVSRTPPWKMVVANGWVYWTVYGTAAQSGSIWRAPTSGGTAKELIKIDGPESLMATSTHLYWTDMNGIGQAKLDGSGVRDPLLFLHPAHSLPSSAGITNDGHYLYSYDCTSEPGIIDRIGLDGTGLEQFAYPGAGAECADALSTANGYLFFSWLNIGSNSGAGFIGRMPIGSPTQINPRWLAVKTELGAYDVAAGGGYVFWTSSDTSAGGGANYIGRAKLDGSQSEAAFLKGTRYGIAVAVGP